MHVRTGTQDRGNSFPPVEGSCYHIEAVTLEVPVLLRHEDKGQEITLAWDEREPSRPWEDRGQRVSVV